MKKLLIILTIFSLPLVAKADWRKPSSLRLDMGVSMSSSGTTHGPSILMETGSYILNEGGGTILKE